jgi:hypothetical protein
MLENLLRVDAVWDIETEAWDTYVTGGIWDARDNTTSIYASEDDLAEHLLSLPKGSVTWAHAGGRFDVLWLLDWCRRKAQIPGAVIRLSGSSIASLAIKGGPVLRDSFRLMPMALADCCKMFPGCALKERLGLPCICGDDCGGYCSIFNDMSHDARRRLNEYLESDIHSLRDTLRELIKYSNEHDLLLGGTVASTGWNTAREKCQLWNAEWELEAYRRARAGYFGGRCEVGQTQAPLVHRYDRKQAYPAALCKPMPVGEPTLLDRRTAPKAWARNKPGIYYAAVQVPEMMAPPLPVRFRDRIVYPWGLVIGSWPREELENAESVGAKILRLHGGIAWPRSEALLKPHVTHCFELREAADNKPLKTWLKFVANSLTGGFAQDPEFDMVALGDYADDPDWEPVGRYDWIWKRGLFAIPARGHVHWAATLTANARVELNKQQVHAGSDWCYSDTDSCYALRMLTRNAGNDLGQWAYEGPGKDWVCIAPKVYKYRDKHHVRVAKAKGIPHASEVWPKIMRGQDITLDRGVDSLLVASKSGKDSLFRRRSGKRHIEPKDGWCGARILDGIRTRPPHMDDLEQIPR